MIYTVTNKSTGAEVYRYAAETPVEWHGMDFDAFTHSPSVEPTLPEASPAEPVILTRLEYANRFSDAELEGIYGASKAVPALEVWLEKFRMAENIDLSDPRTLAGLQALEAGGLLAPGRAKEITDGN